MYVSTDALSYVEKDALINKTWGNSLGFRLIGKEYHMACLACGPGESKDRVFIPIDNGPVRAVCRLCGNVLFPDAVDQNLSSAELAAKQAEWEAKRKAEEKRKEAILQRRKREKPWIAWHEQMGTNGIIAWAQKGIGEKTIEQYKLGYVEQRQFGTNGHAFVSNALTLPAWMYDTDVASVQFRVLNPQNDSGKYRYLYGMPPSLFNAIPNKPIDGDIILVEGAIKAMVLQDQLGDPYHIIAIPSLGVSAKLLTDVSVASRVTLCLDPDAYFGAYGTRPVERIYKGLKTKVRLVQMNVKPDDYFILYGGTRRSFIEKIERGITYEKQRQL